MIPSNSVEVICFDKKCFPVKSYSTDSCFDVRAMNIIEPFYNVKKEILDIEKDFWNCTLHTHGRVLVNTGLQIAYIPENFEIQIMPRSGLALKHGITVLNSPGIIDNSYRGMVGVILINTSNVDFKFKKYDRIAQIKITRIYNDIGIYETNEIKQTDRSSKGFGSTGTE